MEPSKIPISFLKPPTVRNTKTACFLFPQIKPSTSLAASKVFRRRSKSASDLRTFHTKPLGPCVKFNKPAKTSTPVKASPPKRPPLRKTDDENKPKVLKKIPDWDYKSRFHDLQKKHAIVQEEVKHLKLSALKLEQEVAALKEEKQRSLKTIDLLKTDETILRNQLEGLLKKNTIIETNLANREQNFEILKPTHATLTEENNNI